MTIHSQSAALSLAVQTDKTTAATYNFLTALATVSSMPGPRWQEDDPGTEHPTSSTRNTVLASAPDRISFLTPVTVTGRLRPRFIGMLLRAAGFAVSTNDASAPDYYTHTFTLAAPASVPYLTALWQVGSGGDQHTRRAIGLRLTNLTLTATPQNIEFSAQALALDEDTAGGSEVKVAEVATRIAPTSGSYSFTIGGTAWTTNKVRRAVMTVNQALDEADYALWTEGNFDLPQDSIDITHEFGDIDYSFSEFKKIHWGGAAGTGPDFDPVTGALDYTWQSKNDISVGAGVPYSIQIASPSNVVRVTQDPQASGADKIRMGITCQMVDDSSTPVSIVLTNDHASYDYEAS